LNQTIHNMFLLLLFVLFFSYTNSWNLGQIQPIEKTNCNQIIQNYIEYSIDPLLNDIWNYPILQSEIKKNVYCAVIYTNDNKIIIVDKQFDTKFSMQNMHIIKTTDSLNNEIIEQLKKYQIDFYIENYYPSSSWLIWFLYISSKMGYYATLWFVSRSILYVMMYIRKLHYDNYYKHEKKNENIDNVSFDDVAGCDEAKYELQEVVDFLKYPKKFKEAGAKIPSGVLLEGPPGTGKTMLAKATSNEANVNFVYANGSQFIEVYVGVGASRIRKLFDEAKEKKPCIVFIDEIDAIGRSRSNGFEGNSELDQTINQLLTNMDGFDKNEGIVVMGATNRADMLDSALTRKGRFDRKITVGLPDKEGRKEILDVHLADKSVDKSLELESIYELTTGFSGADLANLVNEACILSVRYKLSHINNKCMMDAFEKTTIGLPKQHDRRPKENIKMVAYHEAGHTIGALFFKDIFDVRRVTINANNTGAGGYTLFTPKEEVVQFPTKRYMLARIIVSLGGRAAEMFLYKIQSKMQNVDSLIFSDVKDLNVTIGASNDLKQAHELARNYISTFGLGEYIGLYDPDDSHRFQTKLSEHSKKRIDKEIEKIIEQSLQSMLLILENNKPQLDSIAEMLMKFQTVDENMLNEKIQITYQFT
jgi:cell division protease FtsH